MKTVFFDVDTLVDFLYPAGALYVPKAERLLPVLESLARHAAANRIPIVSTTDAHSENDREFGTWPPHCVAHTLGQHKPAGLLLDGHVIVAGEVPAGIAAAPHVVLQKQTLDCFESPSLGPILNHLAADRYVVYGVVTEYCVRLAALGLLKTGKRVELVTDAIETLNPEDGTRAIEEIVAAGGVLTTSAEVMRSRDAERKAALDRIARDAFESGLYDRTGIPEGGQDE